MKTSTLFQLGGIALLLSGILTGGVYLLFILTGHVSPLGYWLGFSINVLQVLGFTALFARQSQRDSILGLLGYVLLVLSLMFIVGNITVGLQMNAGVITGEQIAQVPGFTLVDSISTWTWVIGLVIFGVSIYRAQVLPKYAGVLVVVVGLLSALTGVLEITWPIYTICAVLAWVWLGGSLIGAPRMVSQETAPAI